MLIDMNHYLTWLGGFVDGEGCFSVHTNFRTYKGRNSVTFSPIANVTQHIARKHILEEITERLNVGTVYTRTCHASVFQTTSRAETRRYIEIILPYLRLKTPAAKEVLRALDLLDRCSRDGVAMCKGERVIDVITATELVEMSASINESPITGERLNGASRNEMLRRLKQVYEQEAIPTNRIEISCTQCGNLFERYFSSINGNRQFFCSKDCTDNWARKTYSTRFKVDVICARCNTTFKRIKSDVKPGNNFCTTSCANRFHANQKKILAS